MSPGPQMTPGRTTVVARPPSPFAARTSCSAAFLLWLYQSGSERGYGVSSVITSPVRGSPSTERELTCTRRPTPLSRQAAMTFRVPSALTWKYSARGPQSVTLPAVWKTMLCPAVARTSEAVSSRSPSTISIPSSRRWSTRCLLCTRMRTR